VLKSFCHLSTVILAHSSLEKAGRSQILFGYHCFLPIQGKYPILSVRFKSEDCTPTQEHIATDQDQASVDLDVYFGMAVLQDSPLITSFSLCTEGTSIFVKKMA